MRGKLIGLLVCVALLGFPCAGMSNEDGEEQQLTPERVDEFKQCLIAGESSWEDCANKASADDEELEEKFQFNLPSNYKKFQLNILSSNRKANEYDGIEILEEYDEMLREQGLVRQGLGVGNLFSGGYRIIDPNPIQPRSTEQERLTPNA